MGSAGEDECEPAALGHHLTSCEPAVLVHALHNTAKVTYVNISGFNQKKKVKVF